MDPKTFFALNTPDIAALVSERGPRVCIFPINGTRRWFTIEHPEEAQQNLGQSYLEISGKRHIELYRLFFDHGIHSLVTPIFGPDLLDRGDKYRRMAMHGLHWFAQDEAFLDFYDTYDVRVKVYGDAEQFLAGTPFAPVLEVYQKLAERTADHQRHRLFFGICAHDPAETVAAFGARFFQSHGRFPTKREIIEAYYGEYVEPVDVFIGFDRPAVFDMPLIATGNEDLYFTVSPSPYLDRTTLRYILYDHLFARQVDDSYESFTAHDWRVMDALYKLNRHAVLGVGRAFQGNKFWYPTQQVQDLPEMR